MRIAASGFQMDNNDPAGGRLQLTKLVMGKIYEEVRREASGLIARYRTWASFYP